MDINKAFTLGSDGALDLMEKLGKKGFDKKHPEFAKDAIAGALKELMLVTYAMAPSEEIAEEMISLAQSFALSDWNKRND